MADLDALKAQFTEAMLHRYTDEIPREAGYIPTRTIQMIHKFGGVDTVRQLRSKYPLHDSDGYAQLCLKGLLELTLEALMLKPEFQPLFSESELAWAREVVA